MSFAELNLNSNIYKALTHCGYTEPTPIQAQAIPDILNGKDIVASAQTGTGKTAAFVLPALHKLASEPAAKKTRILILTPTRELASQITTAANKYGKFLRFNIVNLVGGMPYHQQIKALARGADIIVATPGRLMDHMEQKRVNLSGVEMLVLDEADRMLDMGFIDDVQYIAKLTPAHRQTLLFSATVDKKLITVVRHLLKNPVRIDLSQEKLTVPEIKQELYKVQSPQHKLRLLKHFLQDENIFKAIIFSATKINADRLALQLREQGFAAAALHGDLKQSVRNRTIEQLRQSKIQFLIATDVAARGLDISDITHVINYDLPRFCEDYVHRIGRTGRAGKKGVAISFVLPSDTRHVQRIERYIGQRIKLLTVDESQVKASTTDKSFSADTEILSISKQKSQEQDDNYYHTSVASKKRSKAKKPFAHKKAYGKSQSDGYQSDGYKSRRGGRKESHGSREEGGYARREEHRGSREEGGYARREEHRGGREEGYSRKESPSRRENHFRKESPFADRSNRGERDGRSNHDNKSSRFGKRSNGGEARFSGSKDQYKSKTKEKSYGKSYADSHEKNARSEDRNQQDYNVTSRESYYWEDKKGSPKRGAKSEHRFGNKRNEARTGSETRTSDNRRSSDRAAKPTYRAKQHDDTGSGAKENFRSSFKHKKTAAPNSKKRRFTNDPRPKNKANA